MDTPDSLARDMLKAAVEAPLVARKVVMRSGQNVKTAARRNVSQSAPVHNAHAQYAITYESTVELRGGTLGVEIGYDKDLPGGDLGNLLEYGAPRRKNSPPHRDLGRAADAEEDPFLDAISTFVGKLL